MNSISSDIELIRLCTRAGILKPQIISRDKINWNSSGNYIINLAPSTSDGTHWVALHIKNKDATYFDSFGEPPPLDVLRFLSDHGIYSYLCNDTQIQDIRSGYCGQYCVMFLRHMRGTGTSLHKLSVFLKHFLNLQS